LTLERFTIRRASGFVFRRCIISYARLLNQFNGMPAVMHLVKSLRDPVPVLRAFGAHIGERTIVYPGLVLHAALSDFSNLCVGDECRIGRECFFDLTEKIEIGDTANLGMRTVLITHQSVAKSPLAANELPTKSAPITIGPGAVTFANTIILMGVTLGECAVAAAGAVVSTSVPVWTLVAGNPARQIKRLSDSRMIESPATPQ
jgi:acetyltransferase-like isoleucine patch superfamily enzyme